MVAITSIDKPTAQLSPHPRSMADHPRPPRRFPFQCMGIGLARLDLAARTAATTAAGMASAFLVLVERLRRVSATLVDGDGFSRVACHRCQSRRGQDDSHAASPTARAWARGRALGHGAQRLEVATIGTFIFVQRHARFLTQRDFQNMQERVYPLLHRLRCSSKPSRFTYRARSAGRRCHR